MSRFCKLFQNARYPIMQAPMAGGSTTAMCIAASNAGCIGSLGLGTQTPDSISSYITDVKAGLNDTNLPFNINLFAVNYEIPDPTTGVLAQNIEITTQFLNQYIADNNLHDTYPDLEPGTIGSPPYLKDLDDQIEAVIEGGAPIISCTFGKFSQEQVTRCQNAGLLVVGTATNADEAADLSALGVDGIVLQGNYAGGHRAGWTTELNGCFYPLEQLLDDVVSKLGLTNKIPLLACGGIMTSSDINSLISRKGITGVSLGTVFLNTEESDYIGDNWKNAMRNPELNSFDNIQVTEDFTGKWEMPIINNLYKALEAFRKQEQANNPSYEIPTWPFMDTLSAPFHLTGDTNLMSIYCGRNTSQITQYPLNISVADLVTELVADLDDETKSGRSTRRGN